MGRLFTAPKLNDKRVKPWLIIISLFSKLLRFIPRDKFETYNKETLSHLNFNLSRTRHRVTFQLSFPSPKQKSIT